MNFVSVLLFKYLKGTIGIGRYRLIKNNLIPLQSTLTAVKFYFLVFLVKRDNRRHYAIVIAVEKSNDKRVALFAHEGAGKAFMSELLDIPFPYYAAHFEMKHTGMTAIYFDEGYSVKFDGYARARVMTLSNDSHLFRDGLPTNHQSTQLKQKY